MANMFKKESGSAQSGGDAGKKRQQLLLLLLLLVGGAFGYIYFFTGLINPREQETKQTTALPAQVKQAIPPRSEAGGTPVNEAVKVGAPAATSPTTPVAPSVAKATVAASAKPAAVSAKIEPAKPAAARKVEPAKPVAVSPAKQEATKPAATPVPAKPQKEVKKAIAARSAAPKVSKSSSKYTHANYMVLVGEYGNNELLQTAKAKLAGTGFKPVAQKSIRRTDQMNRLYSATFTDRSQAEAEQQKLKKLNTDPFILLEGGKYSVYAGSYRSKKLASSEMRRLNGQGVNVSIKKAMVTVSVTQLLAGSFPGRVDAEKGAVRLRKKGFSAKAVKKS